VIQTGGLVVNLDTKTVEVNGSRVHLTGRSSPMTWRESRSHRQATGHFRRLGRTRYRVNVLYAPACI
jgi:hypothetical protein